MPDGLDLFYPIVPDVAWLKRLAPLGIRTVQLRLKDASPGPAPQEIPGSPAVCREKKKKKKKKKKLFSL
jgi:thiamine-phosphate pyrophosphorylase